MNDAAVIIPIYKEEPSKSELISLRQCVKILKNHTIIFVAPRNLNINAYEQPCEGQVKFNIERFRNKYFASISGYNQLMLSRSFYKRFMDFEYILVYQLDAYVFKDELIEWCHNQFHYIGAPWFEGFINPRPESRLIGVGNGGFSLRKVRSHLKVLNSFSYITPPRIIIDRFMEKPITLRSFFSLCANLTFLNNTFFLFNNYPFYEDLFWSIIVPERFQWFQLPSVNIAMKFSFELNAELLYVKNKHHLPFGCHGWDKNETTFWKNFIAFD